MLSLLAARALASTAPTPVLLSLQRLLQTSSSSRSDDPRSQDINDATGSAGSEGAAPGRFAGSDKDVKFGDKDACKT